MQQELPRYEDAGQFQHEALMYSGVDDFVAQSAWFIRDSLEHDEPILVVVTSDKVDMLRAELGRDADSVLFSDMREVGKNPARIIPAWREFVMSHSGSGKRSRGIGEPIWGSRSEAELIEAQRHESLLNLAFAGAARMWLLCPYDTEGLDRWVIEEAHRSHPYVLDTGRRSQSNAYHGDTVEASFLAPLSEPHGEPVVFSFSGRELEPLRALARNWAKAGGLDDLREEDWVLAVHELATTSIKHGGGGGTFRIWIEHGTLMAEVTDRGYIEFPLAGREAPAPREGGGYGLWIINQLCDLVQIRTSPEGSRVRIHMARA